MLPLLVAALLVSVPSLPAPCVPGCTIQGNGATGFVPAVAVVQSGATVTWQAFGDSVGHDNVENAISPDPDATCFDVFYQAASTGSATLTLVGGQVFATQGDVTKPCTSATVLPGGAAAVLTYECKVHPLTMKGALVVVA